MNSRPLLAASCAGTTRSWPKRQRQGLAPDLLRATSDSSGAPPQDRRSEVKTLHSAPTTYPAGAGGRAAAVQRRARAASEIYVAKRGSSTGTSRVPCPASSGPSRPGYGVSEKCLRGSLALKAKLRLGSQRSSPRVPPATGRACGHRRKPERWARSLSSCAADKAWPRSGKPLAAPCTSSNSSAPGRLPPLPAARKPAVPLLLGCSARVGTPWASTWRVAASLSCRR